MRAKLNPVKSLTLDPSLYPRGDGVDNRLVKVYADSMQHGAKFPPVTVATVDGKRVIIDGWHRFKAAVSLKQANIQVNDLGLLNRTKAFAESVRLNAIQGKPLDYSDRLAAYKRLVKEGMPIKLVSEEIVFMSEGRMKMYAGRISGPHIGSEPLAPVMTVSDGNTFAGSVSMKGEDGLLQLVRLLTKTLKADKFDRDNMPLMEGLRALQETLKETLAKAVAR